MKVRRVRFIGTPNLDAAIRDRDAPPASRPGIDVWLAQRLLAGMHPKAAVAALDNAISLRSAYRWKKTLVGLVEVDLDGHRATFALRRDRPPARLTEWECAA